MSYLDNPHNLKEVAVSGTALLGQELLRQLRLGNTFMQTSELTNRILGINDSLNYLIMADDASTLSRQQALDFLVSRLPRPIQPRQVVNTLTEYEQCICDDEEIGIPDAPTDGIVEDSSNTFSCVPNPLYPALGDYEVEIEYIDTPPAPTAGTVDDLQNIFSFQPVPGLTALLEYEIELTS